MARFLMLVGGIILVLPGVCSIVVVGMFGDEISTVMPIWLSGLAIGGIGCGLIYMALRK